MGAIYKKELKSYFTSMIGCVFLAIMLVIIGLYFFIVNMLNMYAEMSTTLGAITFVIVLIMPIITMRTLAEENRQKTDQLLFTSPVSVTKIILGKYFALLTVYAIGILIVCTYPLIMNMYGDAQLAQSYSSILGFFLMGRCISCNRTFHIVTYGKSGYSGSNFIYSYGIYLSYDKPCITSANRPYIGSCMHDYCSNYYCADSICNDA